MHTLENRDDDRRVVFASRNPVISTQANHMNFCVMRLLQIPELHAVVVVVPAAAAGRQISPDHRFCCQPCPPLTPHTRSLLYSLQLLHTQQPPGHPPTAL